MAAAGGLPGNFAPTLHGTTFTGATLDTIQNVFHFDTNNFLQLEPGETALDYAELFSVLNDTNGGRSAGSSGTLPARSDSIGGVVSTAIAQPQSRAVPSVPQPKNGAAAKRADTKDAKASRDVTSKRVRDSTSNKNKQQQVKDLEALAAKKSEEMERLTRENNELKFRKQLLEKVVRLRDHQLKVMRGGNEMLAESCCEAVPGAAAAASSNGCSAGSGASSGAVCPPGGGSACAAIRMSSCGCLLSGSFGPTPPLDRERFRSMGKMQLLEHWKAFLSDMSVPLLAIESDPGDEAAAAEILRIAGHITFLLKHASLLAADTVMVASQTHLENDTLSAPDPSHWHNVVRTLELTPEQVAELRAVYVLFSDITRGILAERKVINDRLATGLHGSVAELQRKLENLTISPECEVLQSLQRNMRREKSAHLLLRGFMFGQTLSVLQFAKAAVYSYPWMPDATAIVSTIVEMTDGLGQEELDATPGRRG